MIRRYSQIRDIGHREMDGWPLPGNYSPGAYPISYLIVPGKVYSDEEEQELHRQQEAYRNQIAAEKDQFERGTDPEES